MFLIQNINMKRLKMIFRIVSYTIEMIKEKKRVLIGHLQDQGNNCFSLIHISSNTKRMIQELEL
jgi:hypothetical protein